MSGYDDGPSEAARPRTTGTATSRLGAGHAAVRKQVRARLAISGASGSGKTWTALSVAEVLAPNGPTLVLDTEPADSWQGAAELYADRFVFDTIRWEPPYNPRDLALTLTEAGAAHVPNSRWPGDGGYHVIIVDSASHFWRGQGGTLDIAGGKYTGWKEATPIQDALVDAILRSSAHVIICTRARQDYVQEQGADGKQKVTKLGMAPVQRDDLEYEFQVVAQMDQQHTIEIGKTRCAALAGMQFQQNQQGKFAAIFAEWLAGGVELIGQAEADALVDAFNALDAGPAKVAAKREFAALFGKPDQLPADRLPEAEAWIAARVTAALAEAVKEGADLPGDGPEPPPAPDAHPEPREGVEAAQAAVDEKADTAIKRARARAAS